MIAPLKDVGAQMGIRAEKARIWQKSGSERIKKQ